SMSLRPILRPYVAKEVPVESAGTAKATGNPFLVDPIEDISSVIKAITEAGGAAVSLDLALDLVLNEFVEQAREATRATGAAIALVRDGEMICRATSGNAPELGTRVETTVGLSGAALLTGTVQRCVDTEKDPRVDGEACRQLQLRSMVLVPLADNGPPFGILEVFSSLPDNFSDEDVERLRQLAAKVVESKKETERPIHQPPGEPESSARPADEENGIPETSEPRNEMRENAEGATAPAGLEQPVKNEVLTSALVVLVIAAAVLLGVVIGVRKTARPEAKTPEHAASVSSSTAQPGGAPATTPARQSTEPSAPPVRQPQRSVEPPVGGLIVT